MTNYYIVRFVRSDAGPEENYYYHQKQSAIDHYNLFLSDDSGLYDRIEIEFNNTIFICIFMQFTRNNGKQHCHSQKHGNHTV